MPPVHSKSFQAWVSQDHRLWAAQKISYIGPAHDVLDGFTASEHPTQEFTCDAMFISCREGICHSFIESVALPMTMKRECLLFACITDHSSEEEDCVFEEHNEEVAKALYYDDFEHVMNHYCIPPTSMILSRATEENGPH
jgi:hypothetical protein